MEKFRIKSPVSYIIFFILILFTSCSNWLSIAPENDLIKEKFWTKKADIDGALAATYDAFRGANLQSLIFGEVRADMAQFSATNFYDYTKIASSDISPTNGAINWGNYYSAINLANTLMFYSKDVLAKDEAYTPRMADAVEAEALFIRSISFFYLVRIWKDVPLVLEPSISDTSNLFIGKSSEQVIIKQIIADLLKAKDLAYTTEFQGTDAFYGRANKYAIMSLLADVYLWNQQYQKCMDYCDSVTNSGLYSLEPLTTWFNIYNPGNSPLESIFEIQFNDNLDSQENPIYYNLIPVTGNPQMTITKNVVVLFNDPEDIRISGGRGPIWKYVGKDNLSTVTRSSNERDANWILYRYADILLMKAEAAVELNNLPLANSLVRQTIERAGLAFADVTDQDILREVVRDERGREFMFEGKRWFDLLRAAKRNNFEKKSILIDMILSGAANVQQRAILATKVNDTMSYYLPIPQRDIDYNQNLVQNPYYSR
ncbi:MAG: RagB/SusD family nutrient uptake outer membrane protein [Bacteroidales bacterium]|nr:RagB/SusD family nutrient uptake outer membrane protein [Bacteroidales bacterium]MCB9013596.1 RagB/SusD family nutrient uptake outer membrane protein [Bacteroidales bacterium]